MTIDQVALLPLYAASGTALLVLLMDLLVARRALTVASAGLGGLATAVCAIVVGVRKPTFCAGADCSWVPSPLAVTTGPPALAVPVFGMPLFVSSLYSPRGTRHTMSAVSALIAINSPHGGALHG